MAVVIYGYSDDLVEVDGDLSGEFPASHAEREGVLLACSDGTVLLVRYGPDARWHITPLVVGSAFLRVGRADDVRTNYSDRAHFEQLAWVACGNSLVADTRGSRGDVRMLQALVSHPSTERMLDRDGNEGGRVHMHLGRG